MGRATDWAAQQEGTVLPLYKQVLTKTGVGAGANLLDGGRCVGRFCHMVAKCGARVSGIDATAAMISIAKSRVTGGNFRAGEIDALPYAENRFDLVTGFSSFQCATNLVNALREAVTDALEPFRKPSGGYRLKNKFRYLISRTHSPLARASLRRES